MSDLPRYTSAGIGMARWYFRLGGVLLVLTGVAAWFSAGRENLIAVGILVLLGLVGFAYSFVRPGDQVAHTAKAHIDAADGD
jgi:hypothetical protein